MTTDEMLSEIVSYKYKALGHPYVFVDYQLSDKEWRVTWRNPYYFENKSQTNAPTISEACKKALVFIKDNPGLFSKKGEIYPRKKHLRFDCMYGLAEGEITPNGHPQDILERLGITYQHATPQSIVDQWIFWNCENIPDELPPYLEVREYNPYKMIGSGLSKEDASKIINET